jgi:hypothetical protein
MRLKDMSRDNGTCKLCLLESKLLRSHLVPRAYYKLLRTPGADNPTPITAFEDVTRTSQDQMVEPLLYEICEDRLNKNGERWVLSNYRLEESSPIYRELFAAKADAKFPSGTVYSALNVPGIDMDKLIYFGASIFWRASVSDWSMGAKRVSLIQLGAKYEEQFRQYLNGEAGFPQSAAIWIAVARSETPAPIINFPVGEVKGKCHQHHFNVFGLSYMLYVGGGLTEEITRHCAARTAERYIFFTDIGGIVDRKAAEFFNKSTPTKTSRERAESDGARF